MWPLIQTSTLFLDALLSAAEREGNGFEEQSIYGEALRDLLVPSVCVPFLLRHSEAIAGPRD